MGKKLILACITICACFSSCASTRAASRIELEYQARISQLEGTIKRYADTSERLARDAAAIEETASGIRDSVDRITYLFTEYDRLVREYIQQTSGKNNTIVEN